MKILGFNNDANVYSRASVISDENGKLEYIAISEERLSRVKNGYFSLQDQLNIVWIILILSHYMNLII